MSLLYKLANDTATLSNHSKDDWQEGKTKSHQADIQETKYSDKRGKLPIGTGMEQQMSG